MSETFAPAVRIEHLGESGYALAYSQYCQALIPIFKAHGGRWQRDAKAWMVRADRVEALEAATAPYRSAHASGWIAAGGFISPLSTVIPGVSVDEDGNFWQIVASDSRRFYDDQAEEWVEDWAAVLVIATAEQAADAAAKLVAE